MSAFIDTDNGYQSLLQINNLLVREITPKGLFKCLATYFQEHFGCHRISLSIYEQETDTLSWFANAQGIRVRSLDGENEAIRTPLSRTTISTKEVLIVPRLDTYADDIGIKHMLRAGLRSAASFPLISRGVVVAVIVISFKHYLGDKEQSSIAMIAKMASQIALAVDNMLIYNKLNRQNEYLHEQVNSLLKADDISHTSERFFFRCNSMKKIMKQLNTLAKSDVPVLIHGETGTGKEFISRFIHSQSSRANFNFVKVNCPALSPTLFESELFGHAKGAFTGASGRRLGRFELANNGSIFLDEIGELDIILQAKLLHVLHDSTFERVGESSSITINTRFISATNADLHGMMHTGTFRRDLFYRLGVAVVHVPALRDREGEIIPMFNHLLNMYSADMNTPSPTIHPDTLRLLQDYSWPGNVRELSNLIARLLVLHADDVIEPEHVLPLLEINNSKPEARIVSCPMNTNCNMSTNCNLNSNYNTNIGGHYNYTGNNIPETQYNQFVDSGFISLSNMDYEPKSLAKSEKEHIEAVLMQTKGRVSGPHGASTLLNIPRSTLQYKLKKHGISPKDFM